MHIAVVQHQPTSDLAASVDRGVEALEEAADAGAQLIVFPELSFTPFYPQHKADENHLDLAEPIPGPTTEIFQEAARDLAVVVVINLYELDENVAYDSSPVIDADGTLLGVTRMAHIANYEGFYEKGYYTPADTGASVYETSVGRIGVAICYDRHFPEYLRALALRNADLVLVPQAGTVGEWPPGVFEAEMQTASFQNGYFVALANRVGREEGLEFAGGSFVTDPFGKVVARAEVDLETILYADVDLSVCRQSPARKRFLRDRRTDLYDMGVAAGDVG